MSGISAHSFPLQASVGVPAPMDAAGGASRLTEVCWFVDTPLLRRRYAYVGASIRPC